MLSRSPVASIVRQTTAAVVFVWLASNGAEAAGAAAATPDPPITLADDMNLGDCVSALPKPGCRTTNTADWHQLVLLGVLIAALGFIGWRIRRTIRRAQAARGAASDATKTPADAPAPTR